MVVPATTRACGSRACKCRGRRSAEGRHPPRSCSTDLPSGTTRPTRTHRISRTAPGGGNVPSPQGSAPSGTSGAGASPRRLLDDRLIDELLEELSVVRPLRAGRLGHEDADQLLLPIEPGVGAAESGPHVLARRPWRCRDASPLANGEAEAEGVAGRPEQELAW